MRRWVMGGVVALLAGCTSTGQEAFDTAGSPVEPANAAAAETDPPTETSPNPAVSTTPVLAPSQITGSTVERPLTPEPCRLDDLTMWTASIEPGSVSVRVRNDGTVWCDVDITGSARLDPLAEPTIWLEPGDATTLVARDAEPGCGAPTTIRTLEFAIDDVDVFVPTSLVACGWRLTALYPVDTPSAVCTPDQLTVRWFDTEQLLVVVHDVGPACRLGGSASALFERGDVVVWPGEQCGGLGDLPFDAPEIDVAGLPDCVSWPTEPGGVAAVAPELADGLADGSVDI